MPIDLPADLVQAERRAAHAAEPGRERTEVDRDVMGREEHDVGPVAPEAARELRDRHDVLRAAPAEHAHGDARRLEARGHRTGLADGDDLGAELLAVDAGEHVELERLGAAEGQDAREHADPDRALAPRHQREEAATIEVSVRAVSLTQRWRVKRSSRRRRAAAPISAARPGRLEHPQHALRQAGGVARRDEVSRDAILDQLGQSADSRADRRHPGRHGLQDREGEALDGERGEHHHVDDAQDVGDVAAHPGEDDPVAQAELRGEALGVLAAGPVPDDQQARLGHAVDHLPPRPQEGGVILLRAEHREDPHDPVAVGDPEGRGHLAAALLARPGIGERIDTVPYDPDLVPAQPEVVDEVRDLPERDPEVVVGRAVQDPVHRPLPQAPVQVAAVVLPDHAGGHPGHRRGDAAEHLGVEAVHRDHVRLEVAHVAGQPGQGGAGLGLPGAEREHLDPRRLDVRGERPGLLDAADRAREPVAVEQAHQVGDVALRAADAEARLDEHHANGLIRRHGRAGR